MKTSNKGGSSVTDMERWRNEWQTALAEFRAQVPLTDKDVVVIGCSTSEVIGEKLGRQERWTWRSCYFKN